jgi:hypothetical protein
MVVGGLGVFTFEKVDLDNVVKDDIGFPIAELSKKDQNGI